MNVMKSTEKYKERIKAELNNTLTETTLDRGKKRAGKVRDQYALGDKIALITTDRQSAFDRVLASIPFKGQVLKYYFFHRIRDFQNFDFCPLLTKTSSF